ncbi:hypothetical protein GGH94_000397 [Coemansia aciculifera]|uniref:Uncharacterized protein n=1 Tax=Coemansia aciculifera TaxID=417176 RepID=A0A9W8M7Z8_9FUNG|nr:hypothetical protein GGH94_000397 [Coemansia aciculifera]
MNSTTFSSRHTTHMTIPVAPRATTRSATRVTALQLQPATLVVVNKLTIPVAPHAARPTIASGARAAACATTRATAPKRQPTSSAMLGKLTIPITPHAARPTVASTSCASACPTASSCTSVAIQKPTKAQPAVHAAACHVSRSAATVRPATHTATKGAESLAIERALLMPLGRVLGRTVLTAGRNTQRSTSPTYSAASSVATCVTPVAARPVTRTTSDMVKKLAITRDSKAPSELLEYALHKSSRWIPGRTALTAGRNTQRTTSAATNSRVPRVAPKQSAAPLRAATERVIVEQAAAERATAERIAALHVAAERTTAKCVAAKHILAEGAKARPTIAERVLVKHTTNKRTTTERAVAIRGFDQAGQLLMSLAEQTNTLVAAHNRAVEEVFASGDLDKLSTIKPSAAQVDLALSRASRAYNKTATAIVAIARLT